MTYEEYKAGLASAGGSRPEIDIAIKYALEAEKKETGRDGLTIEDCNIIKLIKKHCGEAVYLRATAEAIGYPAIRKTEANVCKLSLADIETGEEIDGEEDEPVG